MTMTEQPGTSHRRLQRSTQDRMVAGVAGGLGEYFTVDPVLFRVVFGVTAFFGGAGILAYLVAWVLMPEPGAPAATLDRIKGELQRRRVPLWLALAAVAVVGWAAMFSWWAPGGFVPAVIVLVALGVYLSRHPVPTGTTEPTAPAVSLTKPAADPATDPADPSTEPAWAPPPAYDPPVPPATPDWLAASRARRRRAAPVRTATLAALVLALAGLALADVIGGIVLPVYLWTALAVLLAGLGVGLVLRRPAWSLVVLLVPTVLGLVALGGTRASLHDGVGQRRWAPATQADLFDDYRLAFGQTVLDLHALPALESPRTVSITMAAGQTRLLLPAQANVRVHAHIRFGAVQLPGERIVGGSGLVQDVAAPAGATGAPLTVDVEMQEGQLSVERS